MDAISNISRLNISQTSTNLIPKGSKAARPPKSTRVAGPPKQQRTIGDRLNSQPEMLGSVD